MSKNNQKVSKKKKTNNFVNKKTSNNQSKKHNKKTNIKTNANSKKNINSKNIKINKNKENKIYKNSIVNQKNKKPLIIILSLSLVLLALLVLGYIINNKELKEKQEKLKQDILSHYNQYVITNQESDIYVLNNSKYQKVGKVGKNQELTLDNKDITYEDEYLKIMDFDKEYYIYYKHLDIIKELSIPSDRYKKYIVFNQNIITKDITNFYSEEGELVYTLNSSYEFPIIIKKQNVYGVEFNNRLLYINKEDVQKIESSSNTKLTNTKGIAVLNYHFFFDESIRGEQSKCNQSICLSTSNLKKHLDYIKKNNIFTPTMKELEMYIDGYIQLPKSVSITIDDGWRADIGSKIISEYKLNATVFLMSKHYDPKKYQTEYIEVHSHGYDIHNAGVCPGGLGGAIKCLEKSKLLKDLKQSRDKLNNTTVFCYPFYEYNDYSISVLKEAGFTMAFGGYGENGYYKVVPGINKYKLPRYVIYNNTSATNIKNYIG